MNLHRLRHKLVVLLVIARQHDRDSKRKTEVEKMYSGGSKEVMVVWYGDGDYAIMVGSKEAAMSHSVILQHY